jgi:hypothetical protein
MSLRYVTPVGSLILRCFIPGMTEAFLSSELLYDPR